ncbi:MAG TPA: YbaB/EbfC family nucleoid-associated protein [Candidatus Agathobaculum pullicola]|nr:YbaB/EbfC family nucleoid-associated protein [Candidatus Agathobaculum pullicola]
MAKGKGFGGGFGSGMNMQAMMKQAQKMQENMMKAQEEIAQMETTGTAGGGMVTATVTGTATLKSIEIKPDVVDPDDIDMLQDLVVAAVNEALKAANEKSQSQMNAITGGMGGLGGGLF